LFQHVRWCAPGNSQEKRAEHFNRAKKYGYEKKYQTGIGRFTAKLEANRPRQVGEWSGEGMRIKEAVFTIEELVADDRQTIDAYNNDLHPNQKLHKGKTRMQVLLENTNPDLKPVEKSLLYRFIGNETKTTLRRNQYVRVQHADYTLSSPSVIDMLEPGNLNVEAYWLPDAVGLVNEVYIYQNGLFIDKCRKIKAYNEAAAERTEADEAAITEQSKYVARFDSKVKNGRNGLHKIEIMHKTPATWDDRSVEVNNTIAADHFAEASNMVETGFENASDFYAENAINSL